MFVVYVGAFAAFATVFLHHKRVLPFPLMKLMSRLLFPVLIQFTLLKWSRPMLMIKSRRDHYYDLIADRVYVGAAPMFWHIKQLHSEGIAAVVNTCDEYAGPISTYSNYGITQLYIPCVDHFEPSVKYMHDAVRFIEEQRQAGKSVLIHCKGGHGRSAAIAFAWLYATRDKWTAHQVQHFLLQRRSVRKHLYQQENLKLFMNDIDTRRQTARTEN